MSIDRFASEPVDQRGTPESSWSTRNPFASLDYRACERLIIVAPHPDDEVLGLGGWAARLAAGGTDVHIVSVTDGDASHPGSPTLTPNALAERRRAESIAALNVLRIEPPIRLGIGDGKVADHEDELNRMLLQQFNKWTGHRVWCAVPYRFDGHPDHEAAGRAAHRAATQLQMTVVEYPIWLWHWSRPDDPAVPWGRARRIDLSEAELAAKIAATDEYRTQITDLSSDPADRAILPSWVLERLLRTTETVFI